MTCELAWVFSADFADIQEAQGGRREQDAPVDYVGRALLGSPLGDVLRFEYRHPRLPYRTEIRHDASWQPRAPGLSASCLLQPRQTIHRVLRIVPIIVRGLRVGDAAVTLRFWRDEDGASHWDVLHRRGTLHIVRQPPPESIEAGLWERTTAALEGIVK